eukprot:scaffold4311_cov177-Amphora_coffeaeformis.AAC.2
MSKIARRLYPIHLRPTLQVLENDARRGHNTTKDCASKLQVIPRKNRPRRPRARLRAHREHYKTQMPAHHRYTTSKQKTRANPEKNGANE